MEGEAQAANKCNVTAAAETCHPNWQCSAKPAVLPMADLQSQQVVTELLDEAVTKWLGAELAGLVGLVVIAMAIVYGITSR